MKRYKDRVSACRGTICEFILKAESLSLFKPSDSTSFLLGIFMIYQMRINSNKYITIAIVAIMIHTLYIINTNSLFSKKCKKLLEHTNKIFAGNHKLIILFIIKQDQ